MSRSNTPEYLPDAARQTMRTNIEGAEMLKTRVKELTDIVKKCPSQPRDQQFEDIQRRLDALCT